MKKFVFVFISFFCVFSAASQTTQIDSLIDYILLEDKDLLDYMDNNFQFLYARVNYDNKTMYAGREYGNNDYAITGQFFYFHSKGFNVGLTGAWYSILDPSYSTTIASIGYGNEFKKMKGLRYSLSYNRYFYNMKNLDSEPSYKNSLNLGASYRKKHIGTRAYVNILFGKEIAYSAIWDVFTKFTIYKIRKYDKIQFNPELSFYYGKETYAYGEPFYDKLFPLADFESIEYGEDYNLLNIQLELPLSFSYKSFDFEVSYKYNIPRTRDEFIDYPNTSSLSFSLGYIFSLD